MPTESPYRIVLADDHAAFRHYLKRFLYERGGLEVVGEAGDGIELLEILNLTAPIVHMAIVDLKTGAGIAVEPEENKQLMTYAGMVHRALAVHVDKIVLTIVQPPSMIELCASWTMSDDTIGSSV